MCPRKGGGNGRHSEYCSGKSKFRKIFASRYTYLLHRPQLFSCLGREAGGQKMYSREAAPSSGHLPEPKPRIPSERDPAPMTNQMPEGTPTSYRLWNTRLRHGHLPM